MVKNFPANFEFGTDNLMMSYDFSVESNNMTKGLFSSNLVDETSAAKNKIACTITYFTLIVLNIACYWLQYQ